MKPQFSTLLGYALLGSLTFGYTCTIRLGLGIFDILHDPKSGELSGFTQFTAGFAMIDVWQYFAWGSLLACAVWGNIRSRNGQFPEPHLTPWVLHLAFILSIFFLNATGALSHFVMPAYVIK